MLAQHGSNACVIGGLAAIYQTVLAQLPLTPLSFHILLTLVDAERHGYGIMKEIEQRTEGLMSPATGPL